ncbi:hypothetical protein A9Q81_26545 [Gammaproteobacteria bacterium 42_54_T18]|nr:hypothetical protein A9Q81_26545 [Gammaproteobacteria bacterium 42_54_T18]
MASAPHVILRAKHLLCPLCETSNTAALLHPSTDQRSLVCPQNHTFDIAKQGYVNLLPVQQKKSLTPGDNKEMVLARKKFLGLGYYQPLVNALIESCTQHLSTIHHGSNQTASPVILDAGCGEGYYTGELHNALAIQYPDLTTYGFDIAKPAVIEAAKRNKSLNCFVSTIKAIPIAPQSCDLIISVFSPMQPSQFQRLLKPSGNLMVLCAGKNHLHQLKSLLYDNTSDYDEDKFLAQMDSHFTLSKRIAIQQTMAMNSNHDILSLLAMTPHFWRTSPEAKKQLDRIQQLAVDIDVQLLQFTPKHPAAQDANNSGT